MTEIFKGKVSQCRDDSTLSNPILYIQMYVVNHLSIIVFPFLSFIWFIIYPNYGSKNSVVKTFCNKTFFLGSEIDMG